MPLQFLKAVLPDPSTLGPRTVGKTNIGCIFKGIKDGKEKHIMFITFVIIKNVIRKWVHKPYLIQLVYQQ